MSPSNTFFSVMSALSIPLVCVPLPWHLEAWNTGTCLLMIWTAIGLFVTCINSIIWRDDAIVRVEVWCDITTKLAIGWSVGIPAALLCINRRLYIISSVRTLTWTKAEKIRGVILDLAIGVLFPMVVMALHYIVQGHRFNIYEEIGCTQTSSSTWLTFVIIFFPPFIISLIAVSYSIRSFLQLRKCQKELSAVLSTNSTLTKSRFFRLMALASLEILLDAPFQLIIIIASRETFRPWISWEVTHYDFGRIDQFPSVLWKNSIQASGLEFSRWSLVVCALIFFLFFGFAEEARKHYKGAIESFSRRVGISSDSTLTPGHKFGSATSSVGQFKVTSVDKPAKVFRFSGPVAVSKFEVFEKRDSTISFTSVGDTDVDTLHTSSRSNTLTKNSVTDGLDSPTSPIRPVSVHLVADQESFLEFSPNDFDVHKV